MADTPAAKPADKFKTTTTVQPPKSASPEAAKLPPKTLAEQEAGRAVLAQYNR